MERQAARTLQAVRGPARTHVPRHPLSQDPRPPSISIRDEFRSARRTSGYDRAVALLTYLILLFVIGLIVGGLARLLLPGPDPMGIFMTALVGLCGTFSAGLFSWYVLHRHGAGILLSVLFSMLVVWIYRRTHTGGYRRRPSGRF
jgi:uncharacterized membrane protein YeaQ/YmgE (transglycosylase-associated protein family)